MGCLLQSFFFGCITGKIVAIPQNKTEEPQKRKQFNRQTKHKKSHSFVSSEKMKTKKRKFCADAIRMSGMLSDGCDGIHFSGNTNTKQCDQIEPENNSGLSPEFKAALQ
jgi:hypothetical protein